MPRAPCYAALMRTRSSILALLLTAACTSSPTNTGRTDETTTHPDAAPIAPHAECTVYTAREPGAAFNHLPNCSTLDFATHPPTGGTHYGTWAAYQTYAEAVPWGFLVHSMEHGAVVLAYRCDGDCTAVRDGLQAIIDERPVDPLCASHASDRRLILVPDPELEWPIAVVAWERLYLATCLDAPSIRTFIDDAYGHGREDLCHDGADLSATAWCPGL